MAAEQQLQAMQKQMVEMWNELASLRSLEDNMAAMLVGVQGLAALPELVKEVTSVMSVLAERSKPSMIDTGSLGKPKGLDNKEENFESWSQKFKSFVVASYSDARKFFDWCEEHYGEIDLQKAMSEFDGVDAVDSVGNFKEILAQIATALSDLTEGEGQDIVENHKANIAEGWRCLTRRFDPATGGRKRKLLRAILSPGRCSLEDLQPALEEWEALIQRYESKMKKEMDGELKLAGLESLVPEELERHLMLNATRIDTYALARVEIITYV